MIIRLCECGHDLGKHPPHPDHPFSWPCRVCPCNKYEEVKATIHILDAAAMQDPTMLFVRISLQSGHARVYEGLTNR